jgi:hypothetical protein
MFYNAIAIILQVWLLIDIAEHQNLGLTKQRIEDRLKKRNMFCAVFENSYILMIETNHYRCLILCGD